ncbi:MAG TPA: hypothetical protein PKD00_00595 [Burkholderiales bacterium]|nr:hypothetical protein [Burkholderiales bacterium]
MLFNSLNGYKQEINFEVGDKVVVPDLTAYGYWDGPKSGRSSKNIEVATIVEINEYSDYKLLVEYSYPSIKDEDAKQISQVSHVGVTLYVEPATKSRPESKEIYFDESFNETSI